MADGIEIVEYAVVASLGITADSNLPTAISPLD
jgi:hypothetical protein